MATTTQNYDKLDFTFEPDERLLDEKFVAKVAKAAEAEDATVSEVAEQFDIPRHFVTKALAINERGLIAFRTQQELVKNIVKARQKENESWGNICGRLGNMGGTRVRSLYESGADEPYFEHDIGRGGRPRGESNGEVKPKAKAKKAAKKVKETADDKPAKKATKKKAAPKKKAAAKGRKAKAPKATAPTFSDEPTTDEVGEALNGKTVTVKKGKGTTEIAVAEVQAVKQAKSGRWGAKVETTDGDQKTFPLDAITNVA